MRVPARCGQRKNQSDLERGGPSPHPEAAAIRHTVQHAIGFELADVVRLQSRGCANATVTVVSVASYSDCNVSMKAVFTAAPKLLSSVPLSVAQRTMSRLSVVNPVAPDPMRKSRTLSISPSRQFASLRNLFAMEAQPTGSI